MAEEPVISLKQMRKWRKRLAMSEEDIKTKHAIFCAKYPGGRQWQYPGGIDTANGLDVLYKYDGILQE